MLLLGDEWPGCSSYQGSWWFLSVMEPLLEIPRSLSWNPWQTVGCWCQAGPVELPREVLTKFAQISSFQGSDWSTEEWDGGLIMWLLFGPKWCCLNLGDQLIQYPVKERWQSIETGLKMTNHRFRKSQFENLNLLLPSVLGCWSSNHQCDVWSWQTLPSLIWQLLTSLNLSKIHNFLIFKMRSLI